MFNKIINNSLSLFVYSCITVTYMLYNAFPSRNLKYKEKKKGCYSFNNNFTIYLNSALLINKNKKNIFFYPKNPVKSKCLLRLHVLCVSYCSKCLFLYGPFCHGALKLDPVYIFLSTSFQFILTIIMNIIKSKPCCI